MYHCHCEFFVGILTGKCNTSDIDPTKKVCLIKGWCPVERDVNPL